MMKNNKIFIIICIMLVSSFLVGCQERNIILKDIRNIDPCPADTFCELTSFSNGTIILNLSSVNNTFTVNIQ